MEPDDLMKLRVWMDEHKSMPQEVKKRRTFMEIAGIGHLETHWSDVYAYFFNPRENHGMGRLFLDSLCELIDVCDRTKEAFCMGDIRVDREVVLKDAKRIDLVLRDDRGVVIIENKVRAQLYNDLDAYWKHFDMKDECKRGVVLTINRMKPDDSRYVNITHEELMQCVERHMKETDLNGMDEGVKFFLQDFIQNIKNETHTMDMGELDFFMDERNHEQINRMVQMQRHVRTTICNAMKKFALEGNCQDLTVVHKNNDRYFYLEFKECRDIKLTLCYDSLWNYTKRCRVRMFLELQGEAMRFFENRAAQGDMGLNKNRYYWHYRENDIEFEREDLRNERAMHERILAALNEQGEDSLYVLGQRMVTMYKGNAAEGNR